MLALALWGCLAIQLVLSPSFHIGPLSVVAAHDYWREAKAKQCLYFVPGGVLERWLQYLPWARLVEAGRLLWEDECSHLCQVHLLTLLPLLILTFSLADQFTLTHLALAPLISLNAHVSHASTHLVMHSHTPTLKSKHSSISARTLF